jgi:lipopolysaccharide/colanic/teichoic acid biosynthesis glycosyltransferase
VGPRPEWIVLAKEFEEKIPFYKKRYLVKPGIIGWAQINFPASRSLEEVKEKFEYDLYYIKNRSVLLDLEIILKAIKLFFW